MSDKINKDDFELVEENKENFKYSTIARSNVRTEFTIDLVEQHERDLRKLERELEAQISICEKTVDNILRNHTWLKKFNDEKLHHAWMLKENKDVIEQAKPKLEQVKDQLAQYKELLETIYDKFGFVKTDVTTPTDEPSETAE